MYGRDCRLAHLWALIQANMENNSDRYDATLQWLFGRLPMFSRVGAAAYKPGLQTTEELDAAFGHPHRSFRCIHIAGTNGKGSVSHNLASVLMAQGYRTGLYTSPHLVDFRERIRVDGEMIPRSAVVDFVDRFKAMDYSGHPSFFELTMMMAFDWFRRCEVDLAVIEVGMGGRLDSTNVITPIGCVVTNISKDHTQFLGDTLEKIAAEKAGIIKPGIPVTIGEAQGAVRRVFEEKAVAEGAPIRFAEEAYPAGRIKSTYEFESNSGLKLTSPLSGDYQLKNLATVLTAVEMLRENGLEISDEALSTGLASVCTSTGFMGRWTILCNDGPMVIADTGHNEAGLRFNMAQLARLMSQRSREARLRFVIGFVADKDIDHILRLFPADAEYYVTNAQIPRALSAPLLAERCREAQLPVDADRVFATVPEAYAAASRDAAPDDIIYVGGSTFIVADLLASFTKNKH